MARNPLRGRLPQFNETYDMVKMRDLVTRIEKAFDSITEITITEITITAANSPFTLTNAHNNHFIICDDSSAIEVVLPTGLKSLKYFEMKRDGTGEVTLDADAGVTVDGIDGNEYRLPVGSAAGRKTIFTGRKAQNIYDSDGDSYPI